MRKTVCLSELESSAYQPKISKTNSNSSSHFLRKSEFLSNAP